MGRDSIMRHLATLNELWDGKPLVKMKDETRRAIAGVNVTPVYDGVGEDRVFAGYKREIKF